MDRLKTSKRTAALIAVDITSFLAVAFALLSSFTYLYICFANV